MYNGGGMAAVGAGAGGKGKPWHPMLGAMCFFTVMWIAGAVLLPIGITQGAVVHGFDPATDFAAIKGGCVILNSTHTAEQRHNQYPYCVDVYRCEYSSMYFTCSESDARMGAV